jgi:hypothetical protein
VESVESQRQASHSSHEPLGNLAKKRRDSHIPTAPATKADGKVENQKQVSHFPTASIPLSKKKDQDRCSGLRAPSVVPFYSAQVENFHSALDICLTPENLDSLWLLFEAGALSKKLGKARVCTYLLDLKNSRVPRPLGMFQHTVIGEEETRSLLEAINNAQSQPIEKNTLDKSFRALWPELRDKLRHVPPPEKASKPSPD